MNSILDKYVMIPPIKDSKFYNLVLRESQEANQPSAICFRDLIELGSSMASYNFSDLSSTEKQNIWNSNKWVLEPKYDGVRLFLYVSPQGVCVFSNTFDNDIPVEFTDKFLFNDLDLSGLEHSYLLDCVVSTDREDIKTNDYIRSANSNITSYILSLNSQDSKALQREYDNPLKFIIIDCVKVDNNWITGFKYKERQKQLTEIVTPLLSTGLQVVLPDTYVDDKLNTYKQLNNKFKGVIFKNIDSEYITKPSVARDGFVVLTSRDKEKTPVQLKAFITGFGTGFNRDKKEDYINSLDFSLHVQGLDGNKQVKKIAKVMDIPKSDLFELTSVDAVGNIHLNSKYFNRVALLEGSEITPLFFRLKNPVIVKWEDEKDTDSCIIREEILKEGVR